jgi:hypothetical protein
MVLTQRRRRRAVEAWDQAQADAEDSALWLHDRVLPPVLADPSPATTAAAWSAARPRFLELDEQLTALGRSAPDEERRAAVVALRSALADTAVALDRRASADTRQTWAAAQAQAELAAERLARVLAYDAPLGVQDGSSYGAGYPAPQGAAYVAPYDNGYGTGPEAAASVLAAPAPVAPAPRPVPPEDASAEADAEARGTVPPLPRPAPPTGAPPASTLPDHVDGSSGEEDAGGAGGRHVRPHD